MTPDVDRAMLRLEVELGGAGGELAMEALVSCGNKVVTHQRVEGRTDLSIEDPRLWSPDDPFLYDLEVRVSKNGRPLDAVKSYFGMRKIEVRPDEEGKARLYLNGRCTYRLGVVDQGFWPDGLHTAPTDAALRFDVQAVYARRLAQACASGERKPMRLRRLALMALRLNDQATATEAGNAWIGQLREPYTPQCWHLIVALTRTSHDAGFELLRAHAQKANAVLGARAAEKALLDVIRREFLDPHFKGRQPMLDWQALEAEGAARYGELAREAVHGARMTYDLVRSDWSAFARAYAKYYATTVGRSAYIDHALAHQALKSVDDVEALEAALRVMEHLIGQDHEFKFGRYDASELDTYAGLLDKLGQTSEALRWQRKAVAMCEARDREIVENLRAIESRAAATNVSPFSPSLHDRENSL